MPKLPRRQHPLPPLYPDPPPPLYPDPPPPPPWKPLG